MRKKTILMTLVVVALAILLSGCITAPTMSYQGQLTDPAGNPVPNGNYNMTFRLWAPGIVGPYVAWQETQTVAVNNGLFNVTLGNTTPMTPSIFVNQLELGVEVNSDGEMTPRQPLSGAPYAMTLVDGSLIGGTAINVDATYPGMMNISNIGTGFVIAMQSYGMAGVAIDGLGVGSYGVVADNVLHGAIITNTGGTSIYIESSGGGVENRWGVRAREGVDDGDSFFGWATGVGDAATGITARSDQGRGVYAWTDGVGQYAGYFDNHIYVNGGCTGCAFSYVGRNASADTLQPGAAVSVVGVETGPQGMQTPLFKVAPTMPGQAVLGVVVGRTAMTMADSSQSDVKAGAQFGPVGGPAAPGDYLVVVVQGPAQVQADTTAGIQAGSLVYLGANGVTTAAGGQAIGMALDAVGPDGLVWVLVGFR